MRKLLLILLLFPLFPVLVNAQMDTTDFVYTRIDEIQESKQELFIRARNYAFDILKNPKAAIQINDSVSGKIMIHTIIPGRSKKLSGYVSLSINIDIKDNKCRFKADEYKFALVPEQYEYDLSESNFPGKIMLMRQSVLDNSWHEIKTDIEQTTEVLYQTFKTSMNKNDNW